eukprot:766252-Hanusia_phi.AAC.1
MMQTVSVPPPHLLDPDTLLPVHRWTDGLSPRTRNLWSSSRTQVYEEGGGREGGRERRGEEESDRGSLPDSSDDGRAVWERRGTASGMRIRTARGVADKMERGERREGGARGERGSRKEGTSMRWTGMLRYRTDEHVIMQGYSKSRAGGEEEVRNVDLRASG